MNEPFTFYRALDPVKGSWDGYGFHKIGESDFLAFVTDAPSAASIHTPELIAEFWTKYVKEHLQAATDLDIARFELADGINRLHTYLQRRSRTDGSGYQATLSIARKIGAHLLYTSIGDSMLQLFRNGALYRLNESEVWDGSVIIRESQRLSQREKTDLLRFVGDGGQFLLASSVSVIALKNGDRLLFSTDGVEDLISPDLLIPLLKSSADGMRHKFESIFAQERLRDDITFVAVDLEVPRTFDAQSEIQTMRAQVESLRKEQTEFRNDFTRMSLPNARLERIEKNLMQIANQVQSLTKKVEAIPKTNRPATSGYSVSRSDSRHGLLLWIAGSLIVALLLVVGYLLINRPHPRILSGQTPVDRQPSRRAEPAPRSIAPPDISVPLDCNYVVERGDSLEKIAEKKNVGIDSILRWNPALKRNGALKIGEKLSLCEKGNGSGAPS